MSVFQYVNARYGVTSAGVPTVETATFQLVEVGGLPSPWHDEAVAQFVADHPDAAVPENRWALALVTNPFVAPEDLDPDAWYLDLPTSPDLFPVTEEQYAAAKAKYDAAQEALWQQGLVEGLAARQAAYDARAARYRRFGFTADEVIAEIGVRPTASEHDPTYTGVVPAP